MAVNFSPMFNSQVVDSTGAPASGWKVYSYEANSSTPAATYTAQDGLTQQSNPVVLNSLGFPTTGQIWLTSGQAYKLVLTDASDVVQKTEDYIYGVNDFVSTGSEWIASGLTPTYIGATSFSVTGDQTAIFTVGRRLKTTNTGGTVYSTISASAFSSVTTVTVVNDSGTLDSGLATVSYGIENGENSAIPVRPDVIPLVSDVTDPTKRLRVDVANIPTASVVVAATGAGTILPAGLIFPYAGSSVPTGWLYCDGSAVSRTTYAALFTAISTTWGTGDGSTTFNLPNLQGRTLICDGTGTVVENATASSANGITVASNNTKWITGMTVVTSNITGFTTSITAGTYYIYRASATNVRLCSTLAIAQNATTGSMETISGTGTITLTTTFTARTLGAGGGEEGHAQSLTELLSHTHGPTGNTFIVDTGGSAVTTAGAALGSQALTAATGGNAAANIMQPFAVIKYSISY